jgi:hypothetical protein
MTPPEKCPFCSSRKLFPAQFLDEGVSAGSSWFRFPEIKQFSWWQFSSFSKDAIRDLCVEKATACLGCGQLWTPFDLKRALELVQRYGSPEMNARLAAMDQPPPFPVPVKKQISINS